MFNKVAQGVDSTTEDMKVISFGGSRDTRYMLQRNFLSSECDTISAYKYHIVDRGLIALYLFESHQTEVTSTQNSVRSTDRLRVCGEEPHDWIWEAIPRP
ncbi:hypothetical protein ES702_05404 [subsurface metagenome]